MQKASEDYTKPDMMKEPEVEEKIENGKDEQTKEIERPQTTLSKLEIEQGAYLLGFAKANYKRIVHSDGKHIKINGTYYSLTPIVEAVEDKFVELELACNSANPGKPAETRKAIYDFLTFTTSITNDVLKNVDRGELRALCAIIGMMNKGFRDLQ